MQNSPAQIINVENLVFPVIIESKFGSLIIEEKDLLTLDQGIYGFEEYSTYGLANLPQQEGSPFRILQCFNEAGLSFLLTPLNGKQSNLISLKDLQEATEALCLDIENCDFYAITTIQQEGQKIELCLNLKAPFLVDRMSKKGWQYILQNSDYPIHYSFEYHS